jgi:hypothetical protein
MTFGLKNAGATYQRCMQACLAEQIGRNIEVCMQSHDIRLYSEKKVTNLESETFIILKYQLNAAVFPVSVEMDIVIYMEIYLHQL